MCEDWGEGRAQLGGEMIKRNWRIRVSNESSWTRPKNCNEAEKIKTNAGTQDQGSRRRSHISFCWASGHGIVLVTMACES